MIDLSSFSTDELRAELLSRLPKELPEAYFFGVWPGSRAGHFVRTPAGRSPRRNQQFKGPLGSLGLDDWYPDPIREAQGALEPEGPFLHLTNSIWSYLGFWDRSEDTRYNCCSAFLIRVPHLAAPETLDRARRAFPAVFKRFEDRGLTLEPALSLTGQALRARRQTERGRR